MRRLAAICSVIFVIASPDVLGRHRGGGSGDFCPTPIIRIVVPFPPGGSTDVVARSMVSEWQRATSKSVIVQNVSGGNGIVGVDSVAKAADACSVLIVPPGPIVLSPIVERNLPYDPFRDLVPVGRLGSGGFILLVPSNAPVQNLRELLERQRSQRNLTIGSPGAGGIGHFAGELLGQAAGARFVHVPYKGAAPMLNDLSGSQLQSAWADPSSAAGLIRAGKVRALAVSGASRLTAFPDIPTAQEAGIAGFEVLNWLGAFLAARAQQGDVEDVQSLLRASIGSEDVKKAMAGLGLDPSLLPAREFAASLSAERDRWARLARDVGLKPE